MKRLRFIVAGIIVYGFLSSFPPEGAFAFSGMHPRAAQITGRDHETFPTPRPGLRWIKLDFYRRLQDQETSHHDYSREMRNGKLRQIQEEIQFHESISESRVINNVRRRSYLQSDQIGSQESIRSGQARDPCLRLLRTRRSRCYIELQGDS